MSNNAKREGLSTFSKLSRYFKKDLKDIIWPDTMPNPPNFVEKKYTVKEHFTIWKKALELYRQTWSREIRVHNEMDSATRTHGGRDDREKGDNEKNNESSSSPSSSSTIGSELNKLAHTAKSGWRPLVKYLYETRGIAYRDGVKEFIKEYKIGYREAIESERKNSSSENGGY